MACSNSSLPGGMSPTNRIARSILTDHHIFTESHLVCVCVCVHVRERVCVHKRERGSGYMQLDMIVT